jgi:hypothetical protein
VNYATRLLNKRRFDVSMAERDQPKGRTDEPDTKATHGRRTLHDVSDLRQAWSYGKLGPDDLVSIIDTDMLPISEIEELYAGHDMVFYTQQPDAVAGRTKDSQWWIDSDNRLTEEVCGGAVYRHQLYDFASDTISIHQKYDYHGKFVDTLHIYDKVTVDQPDRDGALARGRCLIFLILRSKMTNWSLWEQVRQYWNLEPIVARPLTRMAVVEKIHCGGGDIITGLFKRRSPEGFMESYVSLRREKDRSGDCVDLPQTIFNSLQTKALGNINRAGGKGLTSSEVIRDIELHKLKLTYSQNWILLEALKCTEQPRFAVSFQCVGSKVDGFTEGEEGKPTATLSPVTICKPPVFPTRHPDNERAALDGRMKLVVNKKPFSSAMKQFAVEFMKFLVAERDVGSIGPATLEYVRARQNKPRQKLRIEREQNNGPRRTGKMSAKAMLKVEGSTSLNSPRNVFVVEADHSDATAQIAYAVSLYMKGTSRFGWYAVGKDPSEMGDMVSEFAKLPGRKVLSDFSRMDGRVSIDLRRYVVEAFLYRLFDKDHHEFIESTLKKEERVFLRSPGGHCEVTVGSNISGSGLTTLINTLINAFVEFVSKRRFGYTLKEILTISPLGPKFGDDGLAIELDETKSYLTEAAAEVGMVLEQDARAETEPLEFLSRKYPAPKFYTVSHPVVNLNGRNAIAKGGSQPLGGGGFHAWCKGILATESHVPLLSDFADAGLRIATESELAASDIAIEQDRELSYKIAQGPYPVPADETAKELLLESVCTSLEIGCISEMLKIVSALNEATDAQSINECELPHTVEQFEVKVAAIAI